MSEVHYPLAPEGVFLSLQGEGALAGTPMVFVRLAGCPVNCPGCDTDYAVHERVGIEALRERIQAVRGCAEWLWFTGGEPVAHDLAPLLSLALELGLHAALATSGTIKLPAHTVYSSVDFLSVSPHTLGESWQQRWGDQLNIVPGLNGLTLPEVRDADFSGFPPGKRYITPLAGADGKPVNLAECIDFVLHNRGWKLGGQWHKHWGLP